MANWSLPTLGSFYGDVLSLFKARDLDLAKGLDPAKVTITGPVADMVRWSSVNCRWELFDGTSWGGLCHTYAIDIGGKAATAANAESLGGQSPSYYLPASTFSAANVLTLIKTVDGSTSGLDADLLDGQHGAWYQQALVSGTNIKTLNGQPLLGAGGLRDMPLDIAHSTTKTLAPNTEYSVYSGGGNLNLVLPNTASVSTGDKIRLINCYQSVGSVNTSYIKMPAVGAASINGVVGDMLIDRLFTILTLTCAWNDSNGAQWVVS